MSINNNFNNKKPVSNSPKIKTFSSQNSKLQEITNGRMKRILLNNKYYQLDFEGLEEFLNSEIEFGKYKKGMLQSFIKKDDLNEVYKPLLDIKNLKTFDGNYKLSDIYEFSGNIIKLKDEWKDFNKKMEVTEIVKNIFNNTNLDLIKKYPEIKNVFITKDEGFSWIDILKKDSDYINKLIDIYDFSDPEKNKGLFTYYTNKNNILSYINGSIKGNEDLPENDFNKLSSFEIDMENASFHKFKEKFKEKGLYFIDTETTGLNFNVGSLLSFGYVKIEYNKENDSFETTDKGEIFIKDLKEPITEITANGGAFGKYKGNNITQEIMDNKGLDQNIASEKLRDILENNNILAHNAGFDMKILNIFYSDIRKDVPITNAFYDTFSDVFPFFFQNIEEYKTLSASGLDSLAKKVLGIDISKEEERHTALKDAEWSAEILLKLINHNDIINNNSNHIDDIYDYNPNKIKL